MSELPVIAITMGDPSGIGPEIIVKALQSRAVSETCTPVILGDRLALERALPLCGSPLSIRQIASVNEARAVPPGEIALLELSKLTGADMIFGAPSPAAGDAVYRYICAAADLCLKGETAAMVTAPISKVAMQRGGHDYPGHTELLAELSGSDDFVMMLAGDLLRVSLVTIHEALRDVPGLVTYDQVLKTIRITRDGLCRLTGKPSPRIAVLSLNPHCGESGMFGTEEMEMIEPAIKAARAEGIDAEGPLSADTLFHFIIKSPAEAEPLYDGVVAMYHDQGLIPLKMLHFDDGVNITLGLPLIRTSVDHGTAYDLAGSGTASEKSLLAAIRLAVKMAHNKRFHPS